jgi:hypothetical protein
MIKKGEVKAFNTGAHTATVQIAGSLSVWLEDVKVARNIPAGEVVAGRWCAVLFFDGANQHDAAVIAVYI